MNKIATYEQAVAYMFEHLPMYSKIGERALRPRLDNIKELCAVIGNPQDELKCIHVAGSNGKGSTSHMIAATLQQAGFKTGLYTSPHLVDIRERFRVDGKLIPEQMVVDFLNKYLDDIERIIPSYFELNVALAFYAFKEMKVDYAVIEVGLGGKWDSTNIITPLLSVITNISLEHTNLLGDTLEKIATQKAGIIKPNVPVVIGETQAETEPVFFLNAHHNNSAITFADARWDTAKTSGDAAYQYFKLVDKGDLNIYPIKTDLKGSYQSKNIVTACAAVHVLTQIIPGLNLQHFMDALSAVQSVTGLHGRWEQIHNAPTIIIDVAHNPGGMEYLNQNLAKLPKDSQIHFILGFANDKDVTKVMPYFPKLAKYYFTQASVPRAMKVDQLMAIADGSHEGQGFENVGLAIQQCLTQASPQDIVIITGSFFIVADALVYLKEHKYIL